MSSPFARARPWAAGARVIAADLPLVWPFALGVALLGVAVLAVLAADVDPRMSLSLETLFFALLVGFLAQAVDGTLGMAYGVMSNSFLLALGLPPAISSATVHTAEIFTTGASGASHWRLGNVDRRLLLRLAVPGCASGALGAYVLSDLSLGGIQGVVNAYLLLMGGLILFRSARTRALRKDRQVPPTPLAAVGGFLDATGGGGWGSIVTTTFVANGATPSRTIGSVNAAEFFVTVTQSAVFLALVGVGAPEALAGLLVGGLLAAPLGAHLARSVPHRPLTVVVGVLIVALSVWRLVA